MRRMATILLAVVLCAVAVTMTQVPASNAGKPKNFPPTPTPALLPAAQADESTVSSDGVYYVSPGGSDSAGNGSLDSPWRTAAYALDHGPSNGGFSVVLLDGEYTDPVTTRRSFAEPVRVRAMHDYQAVLVNTGSTPISLGGSSDAHKSFNITFSGLEIKGLGSGSQGYALVYLWKADDVVVENCIIHDSYNNDLMRVLHSARIRIRNSVFYNPPGMEEALDINGGSQDVVVEDSIFFNDYAASGRSETYPRPFVLIKTSGLDSDGITRRITVQRNIFLQKVTDANWPGQVHVGGDSKDYYTAQEVTVQNNLFVASDGEDGGIPLRVSGARDVVIRANTMRSGPGTFQAMGDIERQSSGPICTNVQYANNVFWDLSPSRFIRGDGGDVENSSLENNLYWHTPPIITSDYFNYIDDGRAMLADPLLPLASDRIPMPVWLGRVFAGGYGSVPGAFAAYVRMYAVPAGGSPVVDAASGNMPPDDITGVPRDGAPDVGAYEATDSSPVPTPAPTSTPVLPTATPVSPTSAPTDTPVPPTATPTDTPVPPAATPTDTPVPPTATPTDTPVPPTATPTDTPMPPTATPTDTPVPPTATPTDTPVPPTATPTDTPVPPTATATLAPTSVPAPPAGAMYYVSPGGNDASGNGSAENPWQTVAHALDQGPSSGGFTVVLLDGEYPGPVTTDRSFDQPVLVRAMNDHQAVLVNTGKTPIKLTGSKRAHRVFNITFSGLQIKGRDSRPQGDSLVYLWKADDITFDNCVIHDSYKNDLVRVLHSARITIKDSLFYNPDPGEEALEINGGSQDVVVAGSIFFNDYAASGRSASSSRPFVLITTSGPDDDGITRRITFERNILLQKVTDAAWSGQIHIGDDSRKDYLAQGITVQNNLFVAADGQNVGVPVRVSAARDVVIRANTVRSGPGSFQAMGDIQGAKSGPVCTNIQIANNVFLDSDPNRFIRGDSSAVENSRLENNVYWHAPPITEGDYFNFADDGRRIEADPLLPTAEDRIPMLVLQGHGFAGGHVSIPAAFAAYVQRYAVPAGGSPIVNAASGDMPPDDITGAPRDGAPDVGAYEVDGDSNAPTPTPVLPRNTPVPPPLSTPVLPTPKLTNTPVPPANTDTPVPPVPTDTPVPPAPTDTPVPPAPTDTPVLPTATPTHTPVPPMATSTHTPVPPTDTLVPPTDTPVPPPTDTPVPPPTDTPVPPTATPVPVPPPPQDGVYYVSPGGSDSAGNGSLDSPWRTAAYALDHGPSNGGFTVVLLDGEYPDQVTTRRSFAEPVQVRAMHDYQAVLVNTGRSPISLGGSDDAHKSFNITFSGLEIRGGSGNQGYALVYLWKADDVVLENCIIHDSYNNDLMRVLHSARITIRNCVFYNPASGEESLDINGGSQDVVVADNIFFNESSQSMRGVFVMIKTSNPDEDGTTRRITVERNVFLQKDNSGSWPGAVLLGSDSKSYYEAQEVTIQNNLFTALDGPGAGKAVYVAGSRDVVIRANTMRSAAGWFDAMARVERMGSNPTCANINFYNNLFLDNTGSADLIVGSSSDVNSGSIDSNLYWWGGSPPVHSGDFFSYLNDNHRIVANPLLPGDGDLQMPIWNGEQFGGGYRSIRDAFLSYVQRYAVPGGGSPVVDAASGNMPANDITGSPRGGSPDVGAYEVR